MQYFDKSYYTWQLLFNTIKRNFENKNSNDYKNGYMLLECPYNIIVFWSNRKSYDIMTCLSIPGSRVAPALNNLT